MTKLRYILLLPVMLAVSITARAEKPWSHGRLQTMPDKPFFALQDGTPLFLLGDTGWLLPQRTDRDEAARYLKHAAEAGFNFVQVQVLNGVPSVNRYGAVSNPDGWNMAAVDSLSGYGYWDHIDFIVDTAERNGIYIGMVCIWGGLVKAGLLTPEQATVYGEFLAKRYADKPNIIWIIGGDIQGDVKTEVWDALARSIKSIDKSHLMTYHPRGRHTSAQWFADREWLDFHEYQSGHRRNNQRRGDKVYSIPDGTEEHCWQFADTTRKYDMKRPVIDGEPSYECIPKGLHDADEPVWSPREVRRYAYWDVFAGNAGHVYGHNAVMQFARPGLEGAYHLDTEAHPWWKAQNDEGYQSMKYLRRLMESVPFRTGRPMSDNIPDNPTDDNRIAMTAGDGYAFYYFYTPRHFEVVLPSSSDNYKVSWMDAANGRLTDLGTCGRRYYFDPKKLGIKPDQDGVLIFRQ